MMYRNRISDESFEIKYYYVNYKQICIENQIIHGRTLVQCDEKYLNPLNVEESLTDKAKILFDDDSDKIIDTIITSYKELTKDEYNFLKNIDYMVKNWTTIESLVISKDIELISIDTRDFFFINSNYSDKEKTTLYPKFNNVDKSNIKTIKESEIKDLLLNLKEISGGTKNWRNFSFDIENAKNWELKYIRLFRTSKESDEFYFCSSYGELFDHTLLTKDKLFKH